LHWCSEPALGSRQHCKLPKFLSNLRLKFKDFFPDICMSRIYFGTYAFFFIISVITNPLREELWAQ
jgi:hypothetical protein